LQGRPATAQTKATAGEQQQRLHVEKPTETRRVATVSSTPTAETTVWMPVTCNSIGNRRDASKSRKLTKAGKPATAERSNRAWLPVIARTSAVARTQDSREDARNRPFFDDTCYLLY
jgi:hypothetical protein